MNMGAPTATKNRLDLSILGFGRGVALSATLVIAFLLLGQTEQSVKGQVVTKDEQGIPGVSVTGGIWKLCCPCQQDRTTTNGVIGLDSRGRMSDGLTWRHTAALGSGAVHRNADKESTALFDKIIDSICWTEYPTK